MGGQVRIALAILLALCLLAQAQYEPRPGGGALTGAAWVDKTNGSDSTGALGRQDKPYATLSAAFTAAAAATGNWLVYVMPGAYNNGDSGSGLAPHGANYNIATYWMPGTTWVVSNGNYLYTLAAATHAKEWRVLGYGKFYGHNTQTGGFVTSTYGTTALANITIEADRIEPGTAATTFFDLRGTLNSTDAINSSLLPQNSIRVRNTFGRADAFSYFRLIGTGASPFITIEADYVASLNMDEGNYIVRAGYAEAFKLGTNSFANPSLILHAAYRFKGTALPALLIRRGQAIIDTPNMEVTDGAAACIEIPANADTTDGVQVNVKGARFKQWTGGTAAAINFSAVDTDFRVRLHNCEILMANTSPDSIRATGAITIEAIGSLTTNLALDADITVRGVTPVVEAALWTNF